MARNSKRWVLSIVGLVLAALGALWLLQGVGTIGGSSMTDQTQWVYIGVVVGLVGIYLLISGITGRFAPRRRVGEPGDDRTG